MAGMANGAGHRREEPTAVVNCKSSMGFCSEVISFIQQATAEEASPVEHPLYCHGVFNQVPFWEGFDYLKLRCRKSTK